MCSSKVKFWTLTFVTLKSRSNQKPVRYVMEPHQTYPQKNSVIIAITISLEMTIMCFSITPPGGHIDLKLKNEKNVWAPVAKVHTHQVSSELLLPFQSYGPGRTDRRTGVKQYPYRTYVRRDNNFGNWELGCYLIPNGKWKQTVCKGTGKCSESSSL